MSLVLALWLCFSSAATAAPSHPSSIVQEDLNAVRRARYALRKAKPGTSEEIEAREKLREAKQKLKEDRLKEKAKK
jgi:hypothetical protein